MKPRALDLFCGAGGATRGLQLAGFHVTGVDLEPQPRYCGDDFIRADAIDFLRGVKHVRGAFDLIWASPPCQKHTALRTMHNAKPHVDLIAPTLALLVETGIPWVIENVVGAPLSDPIMLCGTMFGLQTDGGAELHRHRLFKASFPLAAPDCRHGGGDVIGIYGGHYRNRKRHAGMNRERADFTADDGKAAMGIDWMTGEELSQAIPPAYAEYVGKFFLALKSVDDSMRAAFDERIAA
jgi:DNA (cytosine-5)-methyltransferase 1